MEKGELHLTAESHLHSSSNAGRHAGKEDLEDIYMSTWRKGKEGTFDLFCLDLNTAAVGWVDMIYDTVTLSHAPICGGFRGDVVIITC